MRSRRERLTAQGLLSPLAVAAFRRGELRLEAELRWHEEFESKLAAGADGADSANGADGADGAGGAGGADGPGAGPAATVTAAGYQFRFPVLDAALRDIIDREPGT